MINIRLVQDGDFVNWDNYVGGHAHASAYHQIAWKKSVENAYKHRCFYWLAENEKQVIIGILPTVWVKSPISKGSLCALPYCDVGGVLANDDEIEQALITEAVKYCKINSIPTFDNRSSMPSKLAFDSESSPAPKVRMLISFPESSDKLFAGFKSKLRSQIRKAEKNGLTASTATDSAHLDAFYQVFTRNMRDLGSPVHSKEWFQEIVTAYGEDIIIANIYSEGKVIGAGIVLFVGNKACIPWASTNADYNKLAPNMLLYWTLLKFANDKGCKEFDFGRSTLGEGTYRFKSQWGAEPLLLNWQKFDTNGQLITESTGDVSQLRKVVEQTWRKLPVGLTEFLGPKIRRYISL